jgi:hypothetical protein
MLGRPDLNGSQGTDRGVGRTNPEIRSTVFEERASGSEAQPPLRDRRLLIFATYSQS